MQQSFHIVIPARFSSSRLPGKVLVDIQGKPLIQHVYERALTYGAESVTIATDDERVFSAAESFAAPVCMTSPLHENGTDRISEVVHLLDLSEDEIVVNIQGDEPLVPIDAVQKIVHAMIHHPEASMTTLCSPISEDMIFDTHIVKVVLDKKGYALYFSRAPIPWDRAAFSASGIKSDSEKVLTGYYRHVGLYAYRVSMLKRYAGWEKSPYESVELLEMLRVLWQGEKIQVSTIHESLPPGVDTEADLLRVRNIFESVAV